MNRRHFILGALGLVSLVLSAQATPPRLEMYKTPTCGCCSAWVERMAEAGFFVVARDVDQDTLGSLKDRAGIALELNSCHTTFINGYFVEGHVPASDIRRLLSERLAVPGMPIGSPGMELDGRRDAFTTLLVRADGSVQVFARHP